MPNQESEQFRVRRCCLPLSKRLLLVLCTLHKQILHYWPLVGIILGAHPQSAAREKVSNKLRDELGCFVGLLEGHRVLGLGLGLRGAGSRETKLVVCSGYHIGEGQDGA